MRVRSMLGAALLGMTMTASAAPNLAEILAGPQRSAENRARDVYRHPAETLAFFGLKPGQHVVEVWPGAGWYAEILAPYLRESGQYTAAAFVVKGSDVPQWRIDSVAGLRARFEAEPAVFGNPEITEVGLPEAWTAAQPGSADLVLTFRNVHNWLKGDFERRMFKAFYKALKPGGVLGVVEHRARPGTSLEKMISSGYVTEALVIERAESAGFKLEARSEINANAKDSTDHPEGVWTLPPTLRLGDQDRAKYVAIGESDRMTLRFVKPAR
ncbi:putative methyltransferase [Panacagrimonas perspica]|uniref:Putative methyltransferase n=1 Tax=Panacagrimonas perspica TaxID=381431 RepID=A0A4R7P4J5_9GAMM|nr:class I SAM-dependent methyltransferase [Panacagrimonas perspica]TDU28151.1 putative methyltransferase [Panacagrimonas perspica]